MRLYLHMQNTQPKAPLATLVLEFITKLKRACFIFVFSQLCIYKHVHGHTEDKKERLGLFKIPSIFSRKFFCCVKFRAQCKKNKSREEYFETRLVFRGIFFLIDKHEEIHPVNLPASDVTSYYPSFTMCL